MQKKKKKKNPIKLRIVIAKSAFGMGVNVPDIRLIVHRGAPHSIQGYMQQSGRREGMVICLYISLSSSRYKHGSYR